MASLVRRLFLRSAPAHRRDSLSRDSDRSSDAPGGYLTSMEVRLRGRAGLFDFRAGGRSFLLSQRALGRAAAVCRPAPGAPLGLARQPDIEERQSRPRACAIPACLDRSGAPGIASCGSETGGREALVKLTGRATKWKDHSKVSTSGTISSKAATTPTVKKRSSGSTRPRHRR